MTLEFANELLITDVVFSHPERGVCQKVNYNHGFLRQIHVFKGCFINFCHARQPAPLQVAQILVYVIP